MFVVPDGLPDGPAEFVVTNADGFASRAETVISAAAPGIFTVNPDGQGEAIILDADTQTAGPFDPSSGRLRLSIFATGVSHAAKVSVAINGRLIKVEMVGASGLPGLDEIHMLVPAELRGAGKSKLTVTADGAQGNPATILLAGSPPPDAPPQVVITQIFGGGGNTSAPYRNDFIEIFNRGQSPVNLSGWSVQYAGATSSTWSSTPLTSVVLAPGQYYLVQEASGGTNGIPLPSPDATGTINMAATGGKVALVKTLTALIGACPSDPNIIDLVGYGTTATCFRGNAPAPAPGNTNAAIRAANGCTDTRNNKADFTIAQPNPRSIASPVNICAELTAGFDVLKLVHALSLRSNHVAARTLRFRQLPRRPT